MKISCYGDQLPAATQTGVPLQVTPKLPIDEGICYVAVRTVLPVSFSVETGESRSIRVAFEAESDIRQLQI